jgi:mono/diheme cytochrome c family protein
MMSLQAPAHGTARRVGLATAVCLALAVCSAAADDTKPATPMTRYETPKDAGEPAQTKTADQSEPAAKPSDFSAHGAFSNICGFCHEDGGRRAGKGPQLMGTEKTDEQIFERIKFGKPGRMAAFGGVFTDDQIKQIVVYIRNLKPR